jgi:hypothetical protein
LEEKHGPSETPLRGGEPGLSGLNQESGNLTAKGFPYAKFGLRPHLAFDTRGSRSRVSFTNPRSYRIDFTNRIIPIVFQKWARCCVIFRILDFPGIFIDHETISIEKIGNLYI